MIRLGAMILTGGASSRMGQDKAALVWNGRRAVDRVADLAMAAGAEVLVTVGAENLGLPFVPDKAPRGGPVGGVLCGATALLQAGCDRMLVLAVDAPTLRPADMRPLLDQTGRGAAFRDLHLPLVIDLDFLPQDARPDWPMARLVEAAGLVSLGCPPDAKPRVRGANTPAERDSLLVELQDYESAQKGSGA